MPMRAESLEVLEQASVAPAQARAFLRAIELELAGAQDTLATKHDIVLLRQDWEVGRAELRREMALQGAELRREMAQQGAELRREMALQGAELRREMAQQGADLHRAVSGVTRQMYFAVLGQMAVMLGFVYFLITQLR